LIKDVNLCYEYINQCLNDEIYYILNFYLFVAHAINATPLAIKIIENNCRPDICSRMKNMPAPVVTISEPPIMSGLPTATSRPRPKIKKVRISTTPIAIPAPTAKPIPLGVLNMCAPLNFIYIKSANPMNAATNCRTTAPKTASIWDEESLMNTLYIPNINAAIATKR